MGYRDKMAAGEFNQYRPPSFVVGGGQGRDPERARNVTRSAEVRSRTPLIEADISRVSCRDA